MLERRCCLLLEGVDVVYFCRGVVCCLLMLSVAGEALMLSVAGEERILSVTGNELMLSVT